MRISKGTIAAMKAAEIKGASFHTPRHTPGSWMAQAGESEVKIAKVLGHASAKTTERYMHLRPEHLRDTIRSLDKVLCSTVPQRVPCSGP